MFVEKGSTTVFPSTARVSDNIPSSFLSVHELAFVSVCEYYVHTECQDFAVADCKENATYLPGKRLQFVHHEHHWREGNLPGNSKCALCKKTCWTTECLSGYRCEWCGITVSINIFLSIPLLTFVSLVSRYLPHEHTARMYVWYTGTNLPTTTRCEYSKNRSANGSHHRCAGATKGDFVP